MSAGMNQWLWGAAVAVLSLASTETWAAVQTVRGTVSDSAGAPVVGATVRVENTSKGAIVDKNGSFSIALPEGDYTLLVRFIGYREQRIPLRVSADTKPVRVVLFQEASTTDEVVVTASKSSSDVKSTQMGAVQLSAATIQKLPVIMGERDILRSIQLLPGISTASETSTGFNVRGGGADQNLLLLDDAVLYNASHVLGFFSVFNTDAVEDFTLYKAAIPTRYGGRLSSVLEVRQRDGNPMGIESRGGIGLISSRLLVEGPLFSDEGSFLVAGRRSYADLFLFLAPDPAIRNNVAYFYDFNASAQYNLGKNDKLEFSGYLGRDRFEVSSSVGNNYGNTMANLRWNHIFGDNLSLSVAGIYSAFDYEFQVLSPGSEFSVFSGINSITGRADLVWSPGEGHTVEGGIEALDYSFVPGEVSPLRGSSINLRTLDPKAAREVSLYVGDQWEVTSLLAVSAGLRYNMFSRLGREYIRRYANDRPVRFDAVTGQYIDGTATDSTFYDAGAAIASFAGFEPRVSARLLLTAESSVKASYNRTRQNIHLISNTSSPTPFDIWQPSGPYMEPQTADQYSVGYFSSFADEEYSLSVEGYYKDLRNLVEFVDGADLFGNNYIETEVVRGIGRAYGVEVLLEKKKGDLTGWISYTLSRSERKIEPFDGGPGISFGEWYPAVYDRTHVLNVVGMYSLDENWSFSANFIYNTGIPATFPVGRYEFNGLIIPQYDGRRNAQRLPDYHRVDVSARWQSSLKTGFRTAWVFSIYNLYSRLNTASIVFRQDNDLNQTESFRLAIFGIVPSITWEFYF